MISPTPSQLKIRDHEALDLVILAPAGCGKTEALALRVDGLLRRSTVTFPRKVLVLTFSNRAKDNIRDRLRKHLGETRLRKHVDVMNFHGLSARIIKAHGNVVGLDPSIILPENDWVREQCNRKDLEYSVAKRAQDALRSAKLMPWTDLHVANYLSERREYEALEIERVRVAEGRLTYDDLPRVAELILTDERVASLYRCHFAAVIVDEFQDLTPQQLRIVNHIGSGRTTFAGDLAQGIYGFTGAQPTETYNCITSKDTELIEFADSYRSSPKVLEAVNSLNHLTGGISLTCADGPSWPGGGLFTIKNFQTDKEEAKWVAYLVHWLHSKLPEQRIAIMTRTQRRLEPVEKALVHANVEYMRWSDGLLDTETAQVIKTVLLNLNMSVYKAVDNKVAFLRDLSGLERIIEPSTRQSLGDALAWCYELLRDGISPKEILSRIKTGNNDTLITRPGVHVLNGHLGKGQQFDWVIIVGVEDGSIPFYLAKAEDEKTEEARVFSVMLSRARHGAFVTYAENVRIASGRQMRRRPSPFLEYLSHARPMDEQQARDWFTDADWSAIAAK